MKDFDEMDMPCPCILCGEWFELNDGHASNDRSDNNVYCSDCVKEPWGDKPGYEKEEDEN